MPSRKQGARKSAYATAIAAATVRQKATTQWPQWVWRSGTTMNTAGREYNQRIPVTPYVRDCIDNTPATEWANIEYQVITETRLAENRRHAATSQ